MSAKRSVKCIISKCENCLETKCKVCPLGYMQPSNSISYPPHIMSHVCSFGGHVNEYPHPEAEEKAFLNKIHTMNKQLGTVYSPLKKCRRPWIEEADLPGNGCVVM